MWRYVFLISTLGVVPMSDAIAQQPSFERNLSEALREAHDRAADLYNAGEMESCYRIFQGSLFIAKALLKDHPKLQKMVNDGLAKAEGERNAGKRAFILHDLIEQLRTDLKSAARGEPEPLKVPPREVKNDMKPKPAPTVTESKDGVVGRVIFQAQPLADADIMFVSLGKIPPQTYEATSGAQGTYNIADLSPGKYVITIVAGPKATRKLPERYATTTTSPLIFEIKAGGEKLDFLLQ